MLIKAAQELNTWIDDENRTAHAEGRPRLGFVELKIVGQAALIAANLSIELAATMDVDCLVQLTGKIKDKFDAILREGGKHLDPHGHEAWMPSETEYLTLYQGHSVRLAIADPVFVIVSKALKAPKKNVNLIIDYLASDDLDQRFFDLAEKYKIDLESL